MAKFSLQLPWWVSKIENVLFPEEDKQMGIQ